MSFFQVLLTGSDFPYLFESAINYLNIYPFLWSNTAGNGLGQNISFVLGLNTLFAILVKPLSQYTGISWYMIEKVVFLIPYFILSALSAYVFSSLIFKKKLLKIISAVIFATNTYALMIVGGGQFGVSVAYAITPLVLYFIFKVITEKKSIFNSRNYLLAIITFSLQILIDPRLALLTLLIALIFLIVNYFLKIIKIRRFIDLFIISFLALLINAFWILPFVFAKDLNLAAAYTTGDIASFFSFAKLENTISLIHPYYPENIFGKIGFLKFEYLILPIVAFSGLIFVKKLNRNQAAFFISLSLTALIGAFFAKGVNYPGGELYAFIINNIPFATIYRDPMKFYLLVAIAFSVLIPWSIKLASNYFEKKYNKKIIYVLLITFLAFWIFSVRHLLIFGSDGIFKPITADKEFIAFAKEIKNKKGFSRIISFPTKQRFTYTSQNTPVINANDFYNEYDHEGLIKIINRDDFVNELRKFSVEYIILPYDQESKIFLEDRKYNHELFDNYFEALSSRDDLNQIEEYKKLMIFKLAENRDLFWSENENVKINYQTISPVEYELELESISGVSKIIFSQNYSPNWILQTDRNQLMSMNENNLNVFEVDSNDKYKIYYKSQRYVNYGIVISLTTLILILVIFLTNKKLKK